jgi:hypothetical protein
MGKINNYSIDIIKRTKEILENNYQEFEEKDREVTFLMNCLLGLIIAISENEKRKRRVIKKTIDESFLDIIPSKIGFINSKEVQQDFTDTDLTKLFLNVEHKEELIGKDKLWFINKIRNGIAHQNIYGINEDKLWVGVRLWNENNGTKDFEIVFTIKELKRLAIKLAEEYLRDIEK